MKLLIDGQPFKRRIISKKNELACHWCKKPCQVDKYDLEFYYCPGFKKLMCRKCIYEDTHEEIFLGNRHPTHTDWKVDSIEIQDQKLIEGVAMAAVIFPAAGLALKYVGKIWGEING